MRHYQLLPNIDYCSDAIAYPALSNQLTYLPNNFVRYGSTTDRTLPFHCFVDDWRIEAIWRHKYKHVERALMAQYCVLPDYTIETDTPLLYAMYQVWRSRVIGRYWLDHGVYVIPCLQWSRPGINKHLFKGLSDCQVVAVRSPTRGCEIEWMKCAEQFLSINSPELILHFGTSKGIQVWSGKALNLSLNGKTSYNKIK